MGTAPGWFETGGGDPGRWACNWPAPLLYTEVVKGVFFVDFWCMEVLYLYNNMIILKITEYWVFRSSGDSVASMQQIKRNVVFS